ncbi:EAL domain-containing protein [Geovibrio thiophilus]|uniref:EAL domain-containing protein n=1 Tax=Geovibrio thiophilus TaxID=139438 RepID=UPI0013E36A64|nr:EAL domain-containing protein [Geovibrio thiophilus]
MNSFNIREIIEKESVITHFQPIISLKEKRVVGIEALSRGVTPVCGTIIPPSAMFESAKENNCLVELDRLCRKKALQNFREFAESEELILFINLDASILDMIEINGKSWTKSFADEAGIDCSMIAIEIVESRVEKNENLVHFVNKHKDYGFFVTLDDFGAYHSNLDRIVKSKPNIIKIDRSLIANMNNDYYQQSIVRSIIELSRKIGSLTLAEGLETEEDIIKCYELGVDLFQGFYFSEPMSNLSRIKESCNEEIEKISKSIKLHLNGIITRKQQQHKHFEAILDRLVDEIRASGSSAGVDFLQEVVDKHQEIEKICILDSEGMQTAQAVSVNCVSKNGFHRLYWPDTENMDHSLKDYYYFLMRLDIKKFYTDPFMSILSGRLCRTMSSRYLRGGKEEVVCIDFVEIAANMNFNKSSSL